MIVHPLKLSKTAMLLLSIISLVSCGGGSSNLSDDANNTTENSTTSTTNTTSTTGTINPNISNTSDFFKGAGTASLSWQAPTTYSNGESFSDLAGHNIYIDGGDGFVKIAAVSSPGVSNYLVENLTNGDYRFAVTAYDSFGSESALSNDVTVVINS